jgi:hypothetical protein
MQANFPPVTHSKNEGAFSTSCSTLKNIVFRRKYTFCACSIERNKREGEEKGELLCMMEAAPVYKRSLLLMSA